MAYEISIKNKVQGPKRSYCVLFQPPLVNKDHVERVDLLIPVFFKTIKAAYDSVVSVVFKYQYFAFGGVWTTVEGVNRIKLINSVPVKLGTAANDGFVVQANFDDDTMTIKQELQPHELSPQGTFKIKCCKAPPVTTKYVVGLAQRLVSTISPGPTTEDENGTDEDEDPIPIAAMIYRQGKEYQIMPSGRVVAIAFPEGSDQVTVIDDDGNFRYSGPSGKKLPEVWLDHLISSNVQPPPGGFSARKIPQDRVRMHEWKDEAGKLGFTSNRQLKAFHFLTKYNQTQLANFHDNQKLKDIAFKASDWGDKITANEDLNDEFLDDLLVLALFDCILFLDNSTSMDWGQRSDELMDICANIVDVESIYENTDYVRIEFLNGDPRGDQVSTAEECRKLIASIKNQGSTPIGTQLKRKILDRFVYPKIESKGTFRPILICIITDGRPEGEAGCLRSDKPANRAVFKKQIQGCKEKLRDRDMSRVGEKHVLFQISKVGNDSGAKTFMDELKNDKELKSILHCTSYEDVDIKDEEDDPIYTYAAAIARLAGAAFVGLKRNQRGEFEFPET